MSTRIPKLNETWFIEKDRGPWGKDLIHPVTIVDIMDGWVQYRLIKSQVVKEMEIKEFIQVYIPSK